MARANSYISVNKFKKILQDNTVDIALDGTDDVRIEITRTLSLMDMLQFVENVISSCIDVDTGTYTPEVLDFAIKEEILTKYANFRLPSSIEKRYELIYNTDAVDQVTEHINQVQLHEIRNAIDARINYSLSIITGALTGKVNEMTSQLNEFVRSAKKAFTGINPNDISVLADSLSNMRGIDEVKLADAIKTAQKEEKVIPFVKSKDHEGSE